MAHYLGTDGKVGESIEYTSPYSFEKDIKEENYYGVPMSIVPVSYTHLDVYKRQELR